MKNIKTVVGWCVFATVWTRSALEFFIIHSRSLVHSLPQRSMLGEKYPHLLILKEFIKLCERSPTWVSVQSISLTTSDNNAEVSCYVEPFSQKDCFFGGVSCC